MHNNNNNRATMVLSCFQWATTQWGHPSRVRADNGGENVAIGEYMVWFRGENRGSFLTCPSTRNTRIERLWRDVESVLTIFTTLFLFMEANHQNGVEVPSVNLELPQDVQSALESEL